MNNQDNHPMDPSNLHQKSEELAMEWTAGTSEDSADLSPEEMWKTIHELRLQQIELERQNEALRTDQTQIESERKYKTLFREMLDGFALHELICDEQGNPVDYRFLDVNPAFERMTGLKAGAILGRTVLEVIPGTEKHWIETYGKVALTGEPVFFENYSAELGKHFEVKAFRPYDGQFICIIQDITERKQADHVLRECEEKISGVLNNVKAVVWSISWPDLTPIYISPSVENLYDIRKQAFIDNPSLFKELCHPDDKHLTEKAINQLLEEGQSSREYRIIKPDGSIVWIHDKAMFIYDKNHHPVRVDGLAQDITERKQAEQALRESEIKYRTLFESMIEQVHLWELVRDKQGNIKTWRLVDANPASLESWEKTRVQTIGKTADEIWPNSDVIELFMPIVKKIVEEGTPHRWESYFAETNQTLAMTSVAFGEYFFSTGLDITERKQAEEALRESEERFKALHNASFGGIAIHDQGVILDCNQGLSEISGFGLDELIGMDALLLIAEQSRETVRNNIRSGYEKPYEVFGLRKNGQEYPLRLDAKKIPYNGKIVRVVEFRDITVRKQAEQALQQKNEEMEQFVYSVSHDLKSPLVTVKSFAGILRQDLLGGDQQQINKDLNYIDKAADKMQQLLDALLHYSRIGWIDTSAQTVSADQQVQNCLATLAGILQQHQVRVSTGDLHHQLHGDPMHFGQIWQNLIENAVKYRGDQAHPCIEIGATQEGHDVVFYVRDNGMGIAPEHRERIFNLFSQLNPGSDGSGLGLALVKKIVSIYGGRIWVESDGKGKGSCFYFTLPGALKRNEVTE